MKRGPFLAIKVTDARSASDEEWDRVFASSPHATFFHSRRWANVWHATDSNRYLLNAQLVSFDDGAEALIPLTTERRAPGLKVHWSGPAGTYGGWLAGSQLNNAHTALLADFAGSLGSSIWVANPYDPTTDLIRAPDRRPAHTLAIDLAAGFDAVRARWTKGHRSAATQARRSGVTVKVATSEDEWRGYFGAYQDSLRRWGSSATSRYDWRLFAELAALASDDVRLWIATVDGEVVAGALCFYDPIHVCYWHGASYQSAYPFRPSNLILHDAIEEACRSGRRWFDLGSSGGHAGVEAFKRGFGPTRLDCAIAWSLTPAVAAAVRFRAVGRRLVRRRS